MKLVEDINNKVLDTKKVSDKEAEEAFKTILTWMGEDPSRGCKMSLLSWVLSIY